MPGGGKGGSSSSTVNVNNGPVNVDSDSTVEIRGLDRINLNAHVDPLRTDSRQELVIPDPIRTESRIDAKADINSKSDLTSDSRNALSVDLKPVVLDICSTSTSKLPHGQISQPFNYHFGLTWFGMEMFGFNFGGESRMILQDLPKKPAIDWPVQQNAAPADFSDASRREDDSDARRGLRVRIK